MSGDQVKDGPVSVVFPVPFGEIRGTLAMLREKLTQLEAEKKRVEKLIAMVMNECPHPIADRRQWSTGDGDGSTMHHCLHCDTKSESESLCTSWW